MWNILVTRLMASGLTQAEIARNCGCSQAAISGIRNGVTTDPRFSIGAALRVLDAGIAQAQKPTA